MQLPIRHSKFFITARLLFVPAIIASVIWHDDQLLMIPFVYLLLPYLFQFLIHHTEKLFWLLLALLPLSTEINITPSLGLDFPDEPMMMILTGLALLRWWHQPNDFPQTVWRHPLFLLVMVHILWIGIASIYSEQSLLSIKFLLAKIWYIIPFVILPAVWLNSIRNMEKMTLYLLIPMGAVVLITLLRHAMSGFSFESINRHLFPFLETMSIMEPCWFACSRWLMLHTNIPNRTRGIGNGYKLCWPSESSHWFFRIQEEHGLHCWVDWSLY